MMNACRRYGPISLPWHFVSIVIRGFAFSRGKGFVFGFSWTVARGRRMLGSRLVGVDYWISGRCLELGSTRDTGLSSPVN